VAPSFRDRSATIVPSLPPVGLPVVLAVPGFAVAGAGGVAAFAASGLALPAIFAGGLFLAADLTGAGAAVVLDFVMVISLRWHRDMWRLPSKGPEGLTTGPEVLGP